MFRTSRRWILVQLYALGIASGLSAAQAEPRGAGDEIAKLETRYSQSFVTGDVHIAERLLAEDFIGFGSSGKSWDKAAMLAQVQDLPHQASAKITSIVVRTHGDMAVALGEEDDTTPGSSGVLHRKWLDTWRRAPDGWRMIASAEIEPKP